MTKILSIEIDGLCGLHERVELSPVAVFTGPNGSGKSTVVGAVAYALTGRFPGVVGVTAEALQALAPDPAGFVVALDASYAGATGDIRVRRGVQKGKRLLSVTLNGQTIRGVRDAEALIRQHFGDVDWFVDMFDQERSFWRMSQEKRSRWMFELCASASGWTKERVLAQLNISPLSADDAAFDDPANTAAFQRKIDWNPNLGRDAASNVEINLQQLEERLLATQRVAREATSIAGGIAAPAFAPTDEQLDDAEKAFRAAAAVNADVRQCADTSRAKLDQLDKDIAAGDHELLLSEVLAGLAPKQCPTCGHTLDGAQAAAAAKRLADVTAQLVIAQARLLEARRLEAEQRDALTEAVRVASERYEATFQVHKTLQHQKAVGSEREGQLTAATRAEARTVELKKLLEEARVVRRAMLKDSIQPLRKALSLLGALAPRQWAWMVDSDGSFRMARDMGTGEQTVTVEAMSAGEKYRATIALLVATSMIRREPWVGLFLDAFEQVSDDVRADVLLALLAVQKAGHVDNVFVAGAFHASSPSSVVLSDPSLTYHKRARPT